MKVIIRYFLVTLTLLFMSCGKDNDLIPNILETPTAVELLTPENNSECLTGEVLSSSTSRVTFTWEEADVGDTYVLSLTNLESDVLQVYESSTNQLAIELIRGVPYSWYVTTLLNGSESSEDSETFVFYNAGAGNLAYIPFPATALSPVDGATLPSNQSLVTLSWESSDLDDDIVSYDVYFGTNTSPGLLQEDISTTSLEDLSVTTGQVYYWRVVCRDAAGNESSSSIFDFTISS